MNTAQRKASHQKRRWHASPTSWIETLASNSDQCPKHASDVMLTLKIAFEALKSGSGEVHHFNDITAAFSVGVVRAEAIDPMAAVTMQRGIDAMKNCDRIQMQHGRYGFHGPDLAAVHDALELYAGILELSKPIQMELAAREAARRMMKLMQGVEA